MTDADAASIAARAAARVAEVATVEPGLSDDEFARIESELGFAFADDHRAFLAIGVPVGALWPNWRGEGRRSLAKRLQLPVEGVLFAVEWSDFWDDGWGTRPAKMKDALRTARYRLARVPPMIPVHSHHYLPGGRGSFGHSVLSVVQTTAVACGIDLADYIDTAFGPDGPRDRRAVPTVDFWSGLVS